MSVEKNNTLKRKLFILIPDGVSLRNYAYTDFFKEANQVFVVKYLNKTVFDLEKELGIPEIKLRKNKSHLLSDILKKIKIKKELQQFYLRFNEPVYLSYIFKEKRPSKVKPIVKFYLGKIIEKSGYVLSTNILQRIIHFFERTTSAYKEARNILEKEKPDFLLNTSQRSMQAISVILAAQDLGIPTATFIYSWDNLPKATLLVKADFYFVWSDYMKKELMRYYPEIREDKIIVTGTPQFEPHFRKENIIPRDKFFKLYNLPESTKFVCFSGDDITTSPYDEYYLSDLAEEISLFNKNSKEKWAILYRRCPVDFSGREKKIKEKYPDLIYEVPPKWKNLGDVWNKVMPMKEDFELLASTVYYSEWVVNVGSSMVFDAFCHQKPTAYINYDNEKVDTEKWDINRIYKYIHFKSMPCKDAVFWINNKKDWQKMLSLTDEDKQNLVISAGKWFDIINRSPQSDVSSGIISTIDLLIDKNS